VSRHQGPSKLLRGKKKYRPISLENFIEVTGEEMMKNRLSETLMAIRTAKELFDGAVVNLGIGIPTLVSSYVPEEMDIIFHSENGLLGFGPVIEADEVEEKADIDLINATGQFVMPAPGMCVCDAGQALAMADAGYVDIGILGALQVSEKGDISSWFHYAWNIGGSIDVASGVNRLIVLMTHVTNKGEPKILKECSLPISAARCVDLIITDVAVIKVTEGGLVLEEIAPGWTCDEIQAITEAKLVVSPDIREIEF